jgi:Na+/phosphate symporter
MTDKKVKASSWAVGGGLIAGLGVGFFFLKTSALAFVGCMLIGLGLGLLAAAVLSRIGS